MSLLIKDIFRLTKQRWPFAIPGILAFIGVSAYFTILQGSIGSCSQNFYTGFLCPLKTYFTVSVIMLLALGFALFKVRSQSTRKISVLLPLAGILPLTFISSAVAGDNTLPFWWIITISILSGLLISAGQYILNAKGNMVVMIRLLIFTIFVIALVVSTKVLYDFSGLQNRQSDQIAKDDKQTHALQAKQDYDLRHLGFDVFLPKDYAGSSDDVNGLSYEPKPLKIYFSDITYLYSAAPQNSDNFSVDYTELANDSAMRNFLRSSQDCNLTDALGYAGSVDYQPPFRSIPLPCSIVGKDKQGDAIYYQSQSASEEAFYTQRGKTIILASVTKDSKVTKGTLKAITLNVVQQLNSFILVPNEQVAKQISPAIPLSQ